MRLLHYDCLAGISGDMNLGAMVSLGVDADALEAELQKLGLPTGAFSIAVSRAMRSGIAGTQVQVLAGAAESGCESPPAAGEHDWQAGHGDPRVHAHHAHHAHHSHHSWAEIRALIEASSLSARVKADAIALFALLAEAEGAVHGVAAGEVRFHEVGAVDSIVDLVGAAICWEMLAVDAVSCGPVELGGGTVHCAHGVLTVPAPATARLACGMDVHLNGTDHEATTPTGMALLACKARQDLAPRGRLLGCGVGIGSRESSRMPNVLRVMLLDTGDGDAAGAESLTGAVEVAANIDDMTSERLAYLAEKLMAEGAVDVWQEPIVMKKGRLATKMCALAAPGTEERVRACFFAHSSTWGVRMTRVAKWECARRIELREVAGERFHCKVAADGREKIEYEDLKAAASRAGLSLDSQERLWTRPQQ